MGQNYANKTAATNSHWFGIGTYCYSCLCCCRRCCLTSGLNYSCRLRGEISFVKLWIAVTTQQKIVILPFLFKTEKKKCFGWTYPLRQYCGVLYIQTHSNFLFLVAPLNERYQLVPLFTDRLYEKVVCKVNIFICRCDTFTYMHLILRWS